MVVTEKVPDVFPAGIVIVAGTVAEELLLVIVTVSPPTGAEVPMLTVPVEDFPPFTEAGLSVRLTIAGGLTVKVPVAVPPFKVAVSVTSV